MEDWQGMKKQKYTSVISASKEGKKDEASSCVLLRLTSDCVAQERTGLLD